MKSLRSITLAVSALALLAPFAAHAEVPAEGWYVGGNSIMTHQLDTDVKVGAVTDTVKYDGGWGLAGYGGYAFGNGFRAEGEYAYRHVSVTNVTGPSAGTADGGIHNHALMANGYYDINTGMRLTPYVGAGIGVSFVDIDNVRTINAATLNDTQPAFAYQGIAGAALALDDGWSLTADYRYFATLDVTSDTNRAGFDGDIENASHNLMIGIRYEFGAPQAKAPETPIAQPTPARAPIAAKGAAPKVAPVAQSYMVFFDFDKATLTAEAERIIASAAQDFKSGKYVRLVITGHTDTMGKPKYNQKLSVRRANAVKEAFVKLGVPPVEIAAAGVGENGLMVPTSDQVREAQNRRAEIVFNK